MSESALSVSHLQDADMQAVPAALARAALRAREIAARTGTPLIVIRNGKVVEINVNETMRPAKFNPLT